MIKKSFIFILSSFSFGLIASQESIDFELYQNKKDAMIQAVVAECLLKPNSKLAKKLEDVAFGRCSFVEIDGVSTEMINGRLENHSMIIFDKARPLSVVRKNDQTK